MIMKEKANLGEKDELLDPEGSSGGECFEGEINGGGAMRVPAAPLPAIGARLVLLRHERDLPAVQELQQQHEHFVAD